MANEILQKQKTSSTWKTSAGTGTITLTSLANNAGRKGTTVDFGATFGARVRISLLTKFAVSPTAGNEVEVWWCSSDDNNAFDGALTSADAAASDTDVHRQLHYVGSLLADNVTTAQQQSWMFFLPARYGFPVIYNRSGQALSSTAGDHLITVTPIVDEVQ